MSVLSDADPPISCEKTSCQGSYLSHFLTEFRWSHGVRHDVEFISWPKCDKMLPQR